MNDWITSSPSVLAAFMASLVEFVEALTIVLAVGTVRGWRWALMGSFTAALVLAVLIAVLGPAVTHIPLQIVQVVVGSLLLLFGLRWLRKSILRAAGVLALHDESLAYEKQTAAMRQPGPLPLTKMDTLAFGTAFKIVMLEGIEVVFIVIAVGANGRTLTPALFGAALALLVVVVLGLLLHRPLANIPENTLKFAVGVLLSSFGCFWVGEGIGIRWPASDWTLLIIVATFFAAALVFVKLCADAQRAAALLPEKTSHVIRPEDKSRPLRAVAIELTGLFIDDGWLAGTAIVWVAFSWTLQTRIASGYLILMSVGFVAGCIALLGSSTIRRARIRVR